MISAIILAAGKSTRMGTQKLLLPWGSTTVIEKVIHTIQEAGVKDIVLVTNEMLSDSISSLQLPVVINNKGDMLSSLQLGLKALKPSAKAALICLGDQPQVEEGSVRSVCEAFLKNEAHLIFPSYQMRRGHPWLVARPLWNEILSLDPCLSPRDFLTAHKNEIEYVNVDTPSILQDIDTPEDYLKYKPAL